MNLDKLKKGNKIKLIKSNNGAQNWEGKLLKIHIVYTEYYTCKSMDGTPRTGTINIFFRGCVDEFCLVDRKEQADHLKGKLMGMEKEMREIKEEILLLTKYKTEEDYVADKLDRILKAPGKGKIAQILKEMKHSNFL